MHSYARHAYDDAVSIACILAESPGFEEAERVFDKLDIAYVIKTERYFAKQLGDFIELSDSRRPAFLRKFTKEHSAGTELVFVILAAIGAFRASRMFSLRDRFARSLVPGGGYRVTSAAMFDFAQEASGLINNFSWPAEVMDAAANLDWS